MKNLRILFIINLLALSLFSCTDEEVNPDTSNSATITLSFNNVVDGNPLAYNQKYKNVNGDEFTVSALKYYVSNISLANSDGSSFKVDNSYYLIDEISETVIISDVPTGNYTSVNFSIGVDAVANSSTAQTGDLDPNNEMAWNWDTGYKFFLLEGEYNSKNNLEGTMTFHVGKDSNYKTLALAKNFSLTKDEKLTINIDAEVQNVFTNPTTINLESFNKAHGDNASTLANNYATGVFSIK